MVAVPAALDQQPVTVSLDPSVAARTAPVNEVLEASLTQPAAPHRAVS